MEPRQWRDPTFYVFDKSADPLNQDSIGADWLLVTGADYDTYRVLVSAPRLRYEWEARKTKRKTPGNDTGFVLIKKDAVEDF